MHRHDAAALILIAGLATGVTAAHAAPQSLNDAEAKALDKALTLIDRGSVQAGLALRFSLSDPVARQILFWRAYSRKGASGDFATLSYFAQSLDGWPNSIAIRFNAERVITKATRPRDVLAYGTALPPLTYTGVRAMAEALERQGRSAEARQLVRRFWHRAGLKAPTTVTGLFKKYLTTADHYERAVKYAHRRSAGKAGTMAARLGLDKSMRAALALQATMHGKRSGRNRSGIAARIGKLPASVRNHSGFQLSLAIWRRRSKQNAWLAAAPLLKFPAMVSSPKVWWDERDIQIRAAVARKDFGLAYLMASRHRQRPGDKDFVQAEFMAGFLALRFVNHPRAAAHHFARAAKQARWSNDRSRLAYWRGRAALALGKPLDAYPHLSKAAGFGNTIYGQLAAVLLGRNGIVLKKPKAQTGETPPFIADIALARATHYLHRIGRTRLARQFALATIRDGRMDARQYAAMVAWLSGEAASDMRKRQMEIRLTKFAQLKGVPLASTGYPTISLPAKNTVEPALVYALIRQESEFNPQAKSWVGARGYMQLMPFTARDEARLVGYRYSLGRLTSAPAYNLRLGTHHLARLQEMFDGAYPLMLAAYNAGAGRSYQWLKAYGDPRTDDRLDWIDWIELIPFNETRGYVKRVLEALPIYRLRLKDSFDPVDLEAYWSADGPKSRTASAGKDAECAMTLAAFAPKKISITETYLHRKKYKVRVRLKVKQLVRSKTKSGKVRYRIRTRTRQVWRTRTKSVRRTATVATISMLTRPHDNVAGHPACDDRADAGKRKAKTGLSLAKARDPEGATPPAMP